MVRTRQCAVCAGADFDTGAWRAVHGSRDAALFFSDRARRRGTGSGHHIYQPGRRGGPWSRGAARVVWHGRSARAGSDSARLVAGNWSRAPGVGRATSPLRVPARSIASAAWIGTAPASKETTRFGGGAVFCRGGAAVTEPVLERASLVARAAGTSR